MFDRFTTVKPRISLKFLVARLRLLTWCLPLLLLLPGPAALAQDAYPSRPVTIIAPFPAGGLVDFLARVFAKHLTEMMGQTFIVENRSGAGTNIGSALVAKSRADGYTLLLGGSANTVNMTLYKTPGYDIVKDFAPISEIVLVPSILLATPQLPVKSIDDLRALAMSRNLTYASAGIGTPSHMAGEEFVRKAHIKLLHVPYKGAPPAATDVMAGRVDLFFSTIPATIGMIKAGRLKPLAVAGVNRSVALPDVPTFAEMGLPDYKATAWYGFLAPAGTPPEIIKRLNEAINGLLKDPEVIKQLTDNGTVPVAPSTPSEFATMIKADVKSSRALIKATGVKAQ